MAEPLIAGLPPNLNLSAGYIVRLTALDPTTGATVAGVALSNVSVFVTNLRGGPLDEDIGPLLVPTSEA